MDLLVYPGALPLCEAVIHGLPRAELLRQGTPRTTRPQDVQDGIQDQAIRGAWASAIFAWRGGREQLFDLLPQVIRSSSRGLHLDRLPNLLGLQSRFYETDEEWQKAKDEQWYRTITESQIIAASHVLDQAGA